MLEIKKVSPELAHDYIDFFDHYAFSDGSEYSGCYCTYYNWNDNLELERSICSDDKKKNFKRDLAYQWVLQGKLNGFLAYHEGVPIGWCNAHDKQNYDRLSSHQNPETWIDSNITDKILSIVCFIVSPHMRGRGVASELLRAVCQYALDHEYQYIEAYPSKEFATTNYHGQYSMYEKLGFLKVGESKLGLVARKYLNES